MYSLRLLLLFWMFGAVGAHRCYTGQNGSYGTVSCPGDKCAAVKFLNQNHNEVYQLRCFNDFNRFPIASFVVCRDGDAKTPAECQTFRSREPTPENFRNTLGDRAEQQWGQAVRNMGYDTFCCCSGDLCNIPTNREIRDFIPELVTDPTPISSTTTEAPSGCSKLVINSIALCFVLFVSMF